MQVLDLEGRRFSETAKELCEIHGVAEDDESIHDELTELQSGFSAAYPKLLRNRDYEFPYDCVPIRLFWAYLHSDAFYTAAFIPLVQRLLAGLPRSWFAEFECYSPSLESPKLPTGAVGLLIVYKDTVIFNGSEEWADFKIKLGV